MATLSASFQRLALSAFARERWLKLLTSAADSAPAPNVDLPETVLTDGFTSSRKHQGRNRNACQFLRARTLGARLPGDSW
jgi:hypothetical protein